MDVNTDATRAEATRRGDVFLPVYATDSGDTKGTFPLDTDAQTDFDAACEIARELFPRRHPGDAAAAVARALCTFLPRLGLVFSGDEKHADFLWARARCVFAGFGWHLHREIAEHCSGLFPICDLDPDEDEETWQKKLTDAHRMCGWPASLALLQWRNVRSVGETGEHPSVEDWQRVVALLHVLKHARRSAKLGIVVTYLGAAICVEPDKRSNALGGNKSVREQLVKLLTCASSAGKNKHSMTMAVEHTLSTLSLGDLLQRVPTSRLPGVVLSGPWSTVVPDPTNMRGFIQHGLRLTGVWLAREGRVTPTQGDTDDVIGFDWELVYNGSPLEKAKFERSIPATYDAEQYPSDVLAHAFPNVQPQSYDTDPRVFSVMFDAVMCSGILANEVAGLAGEKPLVVCMADHPSLDDSTNQGKTKCSHMLARAICPGIPTSGVSDTDDAAGRRSLAAIVMQFGTLCAQEWKQPKNKSHLLTHENLQILLTGGSVIYGKAYENTASLVNLTYPMFADAKALDVPPDIVNRAFIIWLRNLTTEERGRADVLDDLESGRMSLRVRFAALACCERHNLRERADTAKRETTQTGWRFPVLRAIARMLWEDRFGAAGLEKLDSAVACMAERHRKHTGQADENGVLAVLEAGNLVHVRLHALFDGLSMSEIESTCALARSRDSEQKNRHGSSMRTLLRARADATGYCQRPLSAMAEGVVGAKSRVSDQALGNSLAREIRVVLPKPGDTWALPDHLGLAGWRMVRRKDVNNAPRADLLAPGESP
jgi:hypothetical protein